MSAQTGSESPPQATTDPGAAPDRNFAWYLGHVAFSQFAASLAGVFLVPFLLERGTPVPVIFLSVAGMLGGRFCLRPLVIVLAKAIGLRNSMVVGTLLSSLQYLVLARVDGVGFWLFAWIVTTSVGDVVYWTLFHVLYARIGDPGRLGRQTGVRQSLYTIVGIVGPLVGGLLLTHYPSSVAFAVAAASRALSAAPLLPIRDPDFLHKAPPGAYRAGGFGAAVFLTDGWCACGAGVAWGIIAFSGLRERFDTLGYAMSAASVVGALGSVAIGRLVDLGQASRAVIINMAAAVGLLIAQATAGSASAIIATMIVGALAGGFSTPAMMPAVYGAAQQAPCALRFQFATEGGWDAGAVAAAILAAGLVTAGAPLWIVVLVGIPALLVQAFLLLRKYWSQKAVG